MRILFLTKYYPPYEGGIERYGQMLCTELVRQGIDVEVIAAAGEGSSDSIDHIDGVKIHRLRRAYAISSAAITPSLPSLLRKAIDRADLLHLNFPNPWAEFVHLLMAHNHKSVLTYHCDILKPADIWGGLLYRAYKPLVRRLLSQADAIAVSSPNNIATAPDLQLHRSRCRVIPMPVDVNSFADEDTVAVSKIVENLSPFVLFVGRLVHYKGIDVLIDAINHLPEGNLVIVGQGRLEEKLKQQTISLGLENRVHFTGQISDEERKNLYHACACFALPSTSRAEGFGIVLAEAMACGKPVISTDVGTGTAYVNEHGVTGFVVSPNNVKQLADKIRLFFEDRDLRTAFGERARNRVAQLFDKPIVVGETVRMYNDVLSSK